VVTPGAGAAWSPLDLASLAAWYDFSDATKLFTDAGTTPVASDGDLIYQCNDKSGGNYHVVQATSGARPVYKTGIQNSLSIARFTTDTFLRKESTPSNVQPNTVFVVTRPTQISVNAQVVQLNSSAHCLIYMQDSVWRIFAGADVPSATAPSTVNFAIVAATFNGASSTLWVSGGAAAATGNAGTNAMAGMTLGARYDGLMDFYEGDIAEVVVCSGAMSAADMNLLGSYLETKWSRTWDDVS